MHICQNCSFQSSKWLGKCPSCESWNSFNEETIISSKQTNKPSNQLQKISTKPQSLGQISSKENRLKTGFIDLDTVLGGGFKTGSIVLLGGEPGIGKSTLTLQICQSIASQSQSLLYISGEEAPEQIADRARRLSILADNISLLTETDLDLILAQVEQLQPEFLILDSIQVISSQQIPSMSGSINQIRFVTEALMDLAKKTHCTILLIGHVTKDGNLAGPKVLEHLVDTVLIIEGERSNNLRIIRSYKNRYGSTQEISIMEMQEKGLIEINNTAGLFLAGRRKQAIGSATTITLEGSKPILLEIQALTNTTIFGYPKRTVSGYDLNRTQLLAAVIQKFLKINLNSQDIYLNVIGGLKIDETASDLAVAMAIISSQLKKPLPENTIFLGEIGLTGEIRPISKIVKRIKEAQKIGFKQFVIPEGNRDQLESLNNVQLVSELSQAFQNF